MYAYSVPTVLLSCKSSLNKLAVIFTKEGLTGH